MPKTTNGNGTLVDTLYYRFKGIQTEDGILSSDGVGDTPLRLDDEEVQPEQLKGEVVEKTVELKLRLKKKYDMDVKGQKRPVKDLTFTLSCKNPAFAVSGTDVELLRKACWDFLDKEFAVKWERFYLVKIVPARYMMNPGRGFEFTYKHIERGTAHDGTLLMRSYEAGSRRGFKVEPWPGEFTDKNGDLIACIPDTKENTRALEEFSEMIEHLRERLAAFFRPEQIMETLANLGSIKMLEKS